MTSKPQMPDHAGTSSTNTIYTILAASQSRKKFVKNRLKFKGTSGNIIWNTQPNIQRARMENIDPCKETRGIS